MYKILFITSLLVEIEGKYIEGVLKTNDNWAFLTRFCFLSEEGQFEYHIEFNEDQGDPNLLLYYDTDDQWPAVYKSNKTCADREEMLNIGQNQIVNLTARVPHFREFSGCLFMPIIPTTPRPRYTLSTPTIPRKKLTTRKIKVTKTTTTSTIKPTTKNIVESTTEYLSTMGLTSFYGSSSTTEDFFSSTISSQSFVSVTTEDVKLDYETVPLREFSTTLAPTTIQSVKKPIKKRSIPKIPPPKVLRYGRTVSCDNSRRFRSSRERWWFIAVSNCNGTRGINIRYKIWMTNGPPGDYWHEHFSADEFYILPVLMAFSIAYSFLMLGIVMCSVELKSRQLLHTTYKIFVLSVVLQLIGIMVQSIVYLKYAISGSLSIRGKRFGAMLMGASETCFLLQLLLLAKGYTITRGRLPLAASIKLTIFMCLYIVTYISIFIYEAQVFDPGEVLYLYESPAGYGLIILRIVAWCMFIYSTIFTLKHYPEKANFYYPFNIFGTLWFVAGPAFIISANTYIDKWIRESVVCAVLLFISFGGHLMFLILTMPSVANKNFPYHVRTTQIGIMELTGSSAIEQFNHHVYEPTTTIREQTVIVPLTRRTEEIFEGMYNQRAFSRNVQNGHVNENVDTMRDIAMENVLNWSLAKNVPALEMPRFERIHRGSTGSGNSRLSENSNDVVLSRRSSLERPSNIENTTNNFDDYVRDVPIELFTISKMVVETTNVNKNGNQH